VTCYIQQHSRHFPSELLIAHNARDKALLRHLPRETVAGRLAEEHDMSVVPHPDDPGTEIAVGHPGYGTRLFDPV
jgi:hypothetical protein